MKTVRAQRSSPPKPSFDGAGLHKRLAEAEEALRAIRSGEVDAVVVAGKQGSQVFTLGGPEHAYRDLIESMNEGALTLTADKMILYANQCFARMVKHPLERVIGSSFRRFLSHEGQAILGPLLKRVGKNGTKLQMSLTTGDGAQMPVQISIRPLGTSRLSRATFGMVVTDMTAARRTEEMLRSLTHRAVQAQEAERGRVAFELHDNITQLICAVLFRSQALVDNISPRDGNSKKDAMVLREMIGKTAEEVDRITHNLGPRLLEHLGLVAALNDTATEFEERTGVSVKLVSSPMTARLPADVELAFFRILQEALRNAEKHADARHISVRLSRQGALVRFAIEDDGAGFDLDHCTDGEIGKGRLGLVSMSERAASVGGTLKLRSVYGSGTKIEVIVPLEPVYAEAN